MKKLNNITNEQIKEKGVQALADRPNTPSQYGQSGLTAQQLKLWFDKLATFLASKINEIQDVISGDEAGKYIRLKLDEYGIDSLDALIEAFLNGNFAKDVLKVYPSLSARDMVTLQTLLNNTAKTISEHAEKLGALESNKLDKVTDTNTYRRAYIITPEGVQSVIIVSESPAEGRVPVYTTEGRLNASDPAVDGQVATKRYTDTQDKKLACDIDAKIDPTTYIMTVSLKNSLGQELSKTTIDLPLETVVVSGKYDEESKQVVLVLDNGEEVRFSIADLIDGLVSVKKHDSDIEAANGRINDTNADLTDFKNYVEEHKVFSGYSMYAAEAESARTYVGGGKIDKQFRQIFKQGAFALDVSMDSDYRLTVALKNRRGDVISSGMVDLPIESLLSNASYKDKILTLTFQSGDTLKINISDIVSGLVPETRTVNKKPLSADIVLTASDVGAYSKTETYSQEQTNSAISSAVSDAEAVLRQDMVDVSESLKLSVTMDKDYKLTIALLDSGDKTISSGMVDLPIESLIASASYADRVLTLVFQSGDELNVDISELVGGLVPDTRKVNGKTLKADIQLTAADVGAYAKSETYSSAEVDKAVGASADEVKTTLRKEMQEMGGGGGGGSSDGAAVDAFYAAEAETAHGYAKGGAIDKAIKEILRRVSALENK